MSAGLALPVITTQRESCLLLMAYVKVVPEGAEAQVLIHENIKTLATI